MIFEFIYRQINIFISSTLYVYCIGIVGIISPLLSLKYKNKFFTHTLSFLLKLFFVRNIRVNYNPKIIENSRLLLISNHVCHMDFFVIWICMVKLDKTNLFICAKKSLKVYVKMFQNIIKSINFSFLDRDINKDYITLLSLCKKINKLDEYISVIFPEGTLISRKRNQIVNIQRSIKRNCIPPKNVILPKTTGFTILSKHLKNLDGIIDCTLVYSEKMNFKNFILGRKCSIDVYLDYRDLPIENNDKWLIDLYRDKDHFLETRKLQNINNFLHFDIDIKNIFILFLKSF